jgi:AraC family transcriptional regulator
MRRCLGSLLHVLSSRSGGAATLLARAGYQEYVVYRAPIYRYCRVVNSLNRSTMIVHREDTPAVSKVGATRSREWMHRVMRLLDATVGQLHDLKHPARGTLLEAASLLRQQIHPPSAEETPDGRGRLLAWQARKVHDYIDSHITGPVLVADLCALVQRSEAHFSRSFKRTFGESPHSFVVRRRIELAARHMLTTDATLSDIASCCGFADQAHMCKHFRQALGQAPAAWRRAHRSQHDESTTPPVERFAIPWGNRAPVAAA